jgi:hypothetical protein
MMDIIRFEDPVRGYERSRLIQQRQQLVVRLAESLDIADTSAPL